MSGAAFTEKTERGYKRNTIYERPKAIHAVTPLNIKYFFSETPVSRMVKAISSSTQIPEKAQMPDTRLSFNKEDKSESTTRVRPEEISEKP